MRTLTFHSKISLAKENTKVVKLSSIASEDTLSDLRKLIPEREDDEDTDLIYFSGNAAVLGLVNLNGVGMDVDVGVATAKGYKRRPVNWSHDRYNNIGYITDVGFSSFPDNKVLTEEEALKTSICNLTISGLLWKTAAGGLAEYVEMCDDPDSEYNNMLGFSWEVQFSEFGLALGSKNLSKAQIITDSAEVEKHMKHLREEGGSGFTDDGNELYMVITDKNAKPLAVGITETPAASVRGIVTKKSVASEDENVQAELRHQEIDLTPLTSLLKEQNESVASLITAFNDERKKEKNIEKSEKNISQPSNSTVNLHRHMKFTTKSDVTDFLTTASVTAEDAKNIVDFFDKEAVAAAEKQVAEAQAKREEGEKALKEAEAAKQKITDLEAQIADFKTQFKEIQAQQEEIRKQDVLDSRVADLAEKFDLSSAKTRAFVVKSIASLDETAYAAWIEEVTDLLPAKGKASVDPKEAAAAIKQTQASLEIPNSQGGDEKVDYSALIGANLLNINKF